MQKLLFSCLLFAAAAIQLLATNSDEEWEKLKHITHRRHYVVVLRTSECVSGEITSITPDIIHLKASLPKAPYSTREVAIQRGDVARITDGGTAAHNIVFSARSSWIDVQNASPKSHPERFSIVTKKGERRRSQQAAISEDSISLNDPGQRITLAKSEIGTRLLRSSKTYNRLG